MPTRKPRVTVNLEQSTAELLKSLADLTNTSESKLIGNILDSQVRVLVEYKMWLEQLSEGALKQIGSRLLLSCGLDSLLHEIRKIDPDYKFLTVKLQKHQ